MKRKGRSVREQFERWFKRNHHSYVEVRDLLDGMDRHDGSGTYVYLVVESAWRAFKAGRRSGGGSRQ